VERFSPAVIKMIFDYVRLYGFVCYYTGLRLDLNNPRSPWYAVFDHWIPGDSTKIVLTCALINEMKTDLTEDEFWYYVLQLDNHRCRHSAVRKKHLHSWARLGPEMPLGDGSVDQWAQAMLPVSFFGPTPRIKGKKCCLCGKPVFSNHSMFCKRCARFAHHVRDQRLPRATVEDIFNYVRRYGFVCYYTGMKLEMNDRKSPWYVVLDHWMPHDDKKVVLTSALLNDMKSDLTEDEFWYFIGQLADFRRNGTKIRKKPLKVWFRVDFI
jgi:hypothetical protein